MGAPSKRAKRIRTATEFDIERLRAQLRFPRESSAVYSWSLEDIYAARNAQMRGDFKLPARLAESMRTDDAIFVARSNRVAPQGAIKREIEPGKGTKANVIKAEAEALCGQNGVGLHPDTLADIEGCLVDHGIAFASIVASVRPDGSRVDLALNYWPIEHVRWDSTRRCFVTRVDMTATQTAEGSGGFDVPIVHGDGRWVVFQKHEHEPFKHGTLLAAALVWARHAFANRDWAKGSLAHGNMKFVGEMPAGVALQDVEGQLTAEASAFLEMLRSFSTSDAPCGIRPSGSKTEFVSSSSTAWQVWSELVNNAEKAAARIYLGTDGVLGSQGGAPGVDIQALFGVASTIVQGDLECIQRAINTGLIEPWCALNFGNSVSAPKMRYLLPDSDADAARESLAKRTAAFHDEIGRLRANGFELSQEYVDMVASKHGIDAPRLPAEAKKAPALALAPTDIARVVTVNEARASAGVGPLMLPTGAPDPDGQLTVEQFAAKKAAESSPAPAAPAAPLRAAS